MSTTPLAGLKVLDLSKVLCALARLDAIVDDDEIAQWAASGALRC